MAETLLLEIGVMFAALAAAGLVAARLGASPIPFYMLAGIALNASVLGRGGLPYVSESAFVRVGAELGIVLLLFFLGLEFSLDRVLGDLDRMGRAGAVDLVVNFGVGLALGVLVFGVGIPAVLLAGAVYISSSAVITKTLLDLGWIANPESAPLLGTLIVEDLVIAVYLAVVSAVVLSGTGITGAASSIAVGVAVIMVLLAIARYGAGALDRVLGTPSSEYFLLRSLGIAVLVAGASLALGVSEAVAGFFVGMAFGDTAASGDVERALVPLRDMFAAVFFFWIGLLTDPVVLAGVIGIVALVAAASIPPKLVSGYVGGRVYGLDARRSRRVGLAMVTRGEFSLIIGAVALAGAGSTIPTEVAETLYAVCVGYVLVMSVLGTGLMGAARWLERVLPVG